MINFEKDFAGDQVVGNSKSSSTITEETSRRRGPEIYSTYKNEDDDESEFK